MTWRRVPAQNDSSDAPKRIRAARRRSVPAGLLISSAFCSSERGRGNASDGVLRAVARSARAATSCFARLTRGACLLLARRAAAALAPLRRASLARAAPLAT